MTRASHPAEAATARVPGASPRPITGEEAAEIDELVARGRAALLAFESATQEQVDRLCRAVAWAVANEATFTRLARMGVEESGMGDPESRIGKRFKIMGILRDVLRQKSIGVIEELPEKGIVKYGKPVGLIASLVPATNPELTPPGVAIFAIKCRDAVIFSPHPRSKRTTREAVDIMRRVLAREGAPVDLLQCVERPSIPAAQYLMTQVDMVQATGGRDMVKAAYSSGTPAYGVGAGNATMVIDETADVVEAARNTRISKTSDFGSGCSADGNLVVEATIYEALRDRLVAEGGHLATPEEAAKLRAALWDAAGRRRPETIAISAQQLAERAGFEIAPDRRFFIVEQTEIGRHNPFSSEKLGVVLAMFRYSGFEQALEMVRAIFEVGGKGHSCGIYSFDDDHIDRLARVAPVSRIMVRQPQSKANAGAFNNGMPMTSSLGCGTWGGNITSENIHLKHYMNTTWVSRPIPEDRPSEQELFGEFYGTPVD
jgi:sulfoacetaldehyde dehydrogenase